MNVGSSLLWESNSHMVPPLSEYRAWESCGNRLLVDSKSEIPFRKD